VEGEKLHQLYEAVGEKQGLRKKGAVFTTWLGKIGRNYSRSGYTDWYKIRKKLSMLQVGGAGILRVIMCILHIPYSYNLLGSNKSGRGKARCRYGSRDLSLLSNSVI
jgi:hypothetical protein